VELQELITLFRKQVSDQAKPYLWDDTETLQYAIDSQDMYVRKIGGIRDGSTRALTDVQLSPNAAFSGHSRYVLRIRSARLLTAGRDLKIINEGDVGLQRFTDYNLDQGLSALDDEDTGDVVAMILGITENKIRWLKVPLVADTCRMHIHRLPFPRIKDTNGCLEIDEQHHIHLLMWMKHLAYSKQDAETYDKGLAESNKTAFEKYCADAEVEAEKKRFRPRSMQYGGI